MYMSWYQSSAPCEPGNNKISKHNFLHPTHVKQQCGKLQGLTVPLLTRSCSSEPWKWISVTLHTSIVPIWQHACCLHSIHLAGTLSPSC